MVTLGYQIKLELNPSEHPQANQNQSAFVPHQTPIHIHVTNQESLDEFDCYTQINTDYLPKLQSWIAKSRYTCQEQIQVNQQQIEISHQLYLKIDIFNYVLQKIHKTEMEKIQEEMSILKRERQLIDKEMKMFNFLFIGAGLMPQSQQNAFNFSRNPGVGSSVSLGHLYHQVCGLGIVESKDSEAMNKDGQRVSAQEQAETSVFSDDLSRNQNYNAPSSKNFFIEMKETIPQDAMNLSLNNQGPSSKFFEVLISGPGLKHQVARVSKQHSKKIVHVDETLYWYQCSVNLKQGDNYSIYVPRQF